VSHQLQYFSFKLLVGMYLLTAIKYTKASESLFGIQKHFRYFPSYLFISSTNRFVSTQCTQMQWWPYVWVRDLIIFIWFGANDVTIHICNHYLMNLLCTCAALALLAITVKKQYCQVYHSVPTCKIIGILTYNTHIHNHHRRDLSKIVYLNWMLAPFW
jgi:hypothetical protein